MPASPYVRFDDRIAGTAMVFDNPREIIRAERVEQVEAAFARLQRAHEEGAYLAGYLSYELGYVFEDRLRPLMPEGRQHPLLLFGVFGPPTQAETGHGDKGHGDKGHGGIYMTRPTWTRAQYQDKCDRVLDGIRKGDVYQVNLTFPIHAQGFGGVADIYSALQNTQPVRYGALVCLDAHPVIGLSPELFFRVKNSHISMRPMKGTIKRGADPQEDAALKSALHHDPKNRAENLMIVDLLRNDLTRIARPGTVRVTSLFDVETYPSLHTMTSKIAAELASDSLRELFASLFPCGSVTGAPKIRAMQIIRELEQAPRGVYCGAIGWIAPPAGGHCGDMQFSVAIRTLSRKADGSYTYGTGSGVVADSRAESEYEECLLKAKFLSPEFELIETLGWHEQTGFLWREEHMDRLALSAHTLGFAFAKTALIKALNYSVRGKTGPHKVRLTLARNGRHEIHVAPLALCPPSEVWPVCIGKNRLNSNDPLLAHKTTRRAFIEKELARLRDLTGCKEVLFVNERGHLCEGSFTNLFVKRGGRLLTPPLACGLLPGVLRRVLLETGAARECMLTPDDLYQADRIYIGNSVRGLMPARLVARKML